MGITYYKFDIHVICYSTWWYSCLFLTKLHLYHSHPQPSLLWAGWYLERVTHYYPVATNYIHLHTQQARNINGPSCHHITRAESGYTVGVKQIMTFLFRSAPSRRHQTLPASCSVFILYESMLGWKGPWASANIRRRMRHYRSRVTTRYRPKPFISGSIEN